MENERISCVDGLDGTTLCMGCKQFPRELGERFIVLSGAKDFTGEVVPFGEAASLTAPMNFCC